MFCFNCFLRHKHFWKQIITIFMWMFGCVRKNIFHVGTHDTLEKTVSVPFALEYLDTNTLENKFISIFMWVFGCVWENIFHVGTQDNQRRWCQILLFWSSRRLWASWPGCSDLSVVRYLILLWTPSLYLNWLYKINLAQKAGCTTCCQIVGKGWA